MIMAVMAIIIRSAKLEPKFAAQVGLTAFAASCPTSMILLTGDSTLNVVAMNFAGVEASWLKWLLYMGVPGIVTSLLLYLIQRVQGFLPLNPQKLGAVTPPDLAFNTAASFTTNTNWQAYSGETTMSYFTQMAGLAYHNFVSAATGIALAIAFIRGIARRQMETIGNFWVDITRCLFYILLPIAFVFGIIFVAQGATNVLFVWCPAHTGNSLKWWPGDAYIDVYGVDGYDKAGTGATAVYMFSAFLKTWEPRTIKPIFICETAAQAYVDQVAYLQAVPRFLHNHPQIAAFIYFSSPASPQYPDNWELEDGLPAYAALIAAQPQARVR